MCSETAFILIPRKISLCLVSTADTTSALDHSYICTWNYKFLKGAGVAVFSSLYLSAHTGQCLEQNSHSVKVCRTGMSLAWFTDCSQVILKPPINLGKQLSLTPEQVFHCSTAWYSTVSHSYCKKHRWIRWADCPLWLWRPTQCRQQQCSQCAERLEVFSEWTNQLKKL